MSILALDYGTKRIGVAKTDSLNLIASPLDTVDTAQIFNFIAQIAETENIETIVLGFPKHNKKSDIQETIREFRTKLEQKFSFPVVMFDERFTSKMALESMITAGSKKKDRQKKAGNIDKISACIILQDYLNQPT